MSFLPAQHRRRSWPLVLFALLLFGYVQEGAKVRLNHYIEVTASQPDFEALDPAGRARWWSGHAPPATDGLFSTRSTFDSFHSMSLHRLVLLKWAWAAAIVAMFFALDAALLWALGVGHRWRLLALMYAIAGAVVLSFYAMSYALNGGAPAQGFRPGYHVAREVLGFLQSPLPSLLLVFVPALLARSNAGKA